MANYTKNTNFGAKDALVTGEAEKIILGADMDAEFDEIATRSADKEDKTNKGAVSGYCALDASQLVAAANLPTATESVVGILELSTQAEAEALASNAKYITPHTLNDVLADNASLLQDLQALADPNADRLLMWDDSANAMVFLSLDTNSGLAFDLTNIKIDLNDLATFSGTIVDGDFISMVDVTDGSSNKMTFALFEGDLEVAKLIGGVANLVDPTGVALTAGTGLSYSSGGDSFGVSGTMILDPSGISTMNITNINVTEDGMLMSDDGVIKIMPLDEAGVDVITSSVAQTFALADAQTYQLLILDTDRTWDVPTNAAVAFKIGTCILIGTRDAADLLLSSSSGVRLTSSLRSGTGLTAGDHTILAGGTAMVIKVATDEWMVMGAVT